MAEQFVDLAPLHRSQAEGGRQAVQVVDAARAESSDGTLEPFLVPSSLPPTRRKRARSRADKSGLFRGFADVPLEPEPIRAWAEEHGFLGALEDIRLPDGETLAGEPLRRWLLEIVDMRDVLRLWDDWKRHDYNRLAKEPIVQRFAEVRGDRLPLDPRTDRSPILAAAREAIGFKVTAHFQAAQGSASYIRPLPVQLRLEVGPDRPFALHLAPRSLLGALWLQVALAIDGNKEYKRCPRCGTWWEVQPDIARTNRVYCSTACKQAAWRARPRTPEGSLA